MRRNPFTHSGYRWLWSGQLVSLTGDQLFPMAMVGIALDRRQPVLSVSLIFASRFLALALFIVFGGVLADRLDKLRLMMSSDLIRLGAVVLLTVLGTGSPLWALVVITFVIGSGGAVFQPAYDSVVPSIVPAEDLKEANAAGTMLKNVSQLIGPGAAALVVGGLGAVVALWIDAATFGVSTCTLLVVARRVGRRSRRPQQPADSMFAAAVAGVRIVVGMRWLMALEWIAVLQVLLAVGPWFVLVPVIAKDRLGGLAGYGLLLSMFAVGGVGGAVAAGWLQKQFSRPGLWGLLGLSLFGVACCAFAVTDSLWLLASMFAAAGAGTQFFDVLKTTAIQQHVPGEFLGRVFALDFLASFVTMPAGQLLAGLFVVGADQAVTVLTVAGAFVFATTLVPLLLPGVVTMGRDGGAACDEMGRVSHAFGPDRRSQAMRSSIVLGRAHGRQRKSDSLRGNT
jgi:MFS family permease